MGRKALNTVSIPVIEPLSEIERKSPRLVEQLKYCEDALAEGEKFNDGIPTVPLILKPLAMIFEPLNFEHRNHQKYVDSAYKSFVDIRKSFHEALEKHKDCYHQVLSYESQIMTDPNLSNCKKHLNKLWDMFAYGDDYYNNQFMSYYGKYKLELDQAMAQVET